MENSIQTEVRPSEKGQKGHYSRTQSYFDRSPIIRFFLWGTFALILFVFLHFRQVYVESFDLGSIAKKYVVAQVDFVFPDEEATIILKQEAGREIGTIYRINEEDVFKQITEFQKYITQDPKGNQIWSQIGKEGTFKNLAQLLNLVSGHLLDSRFSDIRTIERIESLPREKLPIPFDEFYVFLPGEGRRKARLPSHFWSGIKESVIEKKEVGPHILNFVLSYFEEVPWSFKVDEESAFLLRKVIFLEIPEKFTFVKAGERILDQGERVTTRHLSMLKAMRERLEEKSHHFHLLPLLGSVLMTSLFLGVFYFYLKKSHPTLFTSNRKFGLIASVFILNLTLAKLTELFLLQSPNQLLDVVRFPLFVPFSALLLASLLNLRIAAFSTLFLTVIFTMSLAVESVTFLVVNVIASSIAILSMKRIRRRKEVFIVGAKAWLGSVLVVLAFNLYADSLFSFTFIADVISTFLFMGTTCILVVGLLPIFESSFQIITDITLMELMDPNNDILRRLSIEASGTYQHSVLVGSLAEAAAQTIGANGLFCRAATLYHDIGKLMNPQYFAENQMGKLDMHQLLTPLESAKAIIAHVSDGVAMARKLGLPEPFIDIIKEHHGTTLVYYFYHKQLELMGGDKTRVHRGDFRYDGPKPTTKESSIIMIADTLEAASRSLDVFNEETVIDLVHALVAQKTEDGQFDHSPLTYEEMSRVKTAIIHALLATSHSRIKYPPHHPGEEG